MTLGFLSSPTAHAIELYADALYWQATETVDWSLTNNLSLPNQVISYNTIDFDFAPGFRVGAGMQVKDWSYRSLYMHYSVVEKASTQGNVISIFIPGKFAEAFYNTGQVNFTIDMNMVDLDFSKEIVIGRAFSIRPLFGLKGGTINQEVNTHFQGDITVNERVHNDFTGLGPKVGIDSRWNFYSADFLQYSFAAEIQSAFMWGKWSIDDNMAQSNSTLISSVQVGKRNVGAFELQGFFGIELRYKNAGLKIGYEVSDWFNQYQLFDDGTGTHTNDLVLQGITAALTYRS